MYVCILLHNYNKNQHQNDGRLQCSSLHTSIHQICYPKKLLPDEGSQLINGCDSMKINYTDVKQQLHLQVDVEYETCPTAAHYIHGKVEMKIRQIKDSVGKNLFNQRLSVLQWETFAAEISNSVNNLPLAFGSICSDLDNLDLISPNRLRLGRNNDRSPVGAMEVITTPSRFFKTTRRFSTHGSKIGCYHMFQN